MINQVEYRFNHIADFEDKTLDWKAINVHVCWKKVLHLEMDIGDILIPVASLVGNVVENDVEQ